MFLTQKLTELAHSFFLKNSVLVTNSAFMALSTVFLSIHSPDNSPLSHSVLPVSFLLYWGPFNCISLYESLSALILSFVVDWTYSTN